MRMRLRVPLILGGLLLAVASDAQSLQSAAGGVSNGTIESALPAGIPGPLSGVLDAESYRLGPGDALVVNIWGPLSMSVPIEVGPDGYAFIPGRGSIYVADMTLDAARHRIEALVRQQYRNVQVEIRLIRVRTIFVYRTGEVIEPGPVLAQGSSRVADLLPDTIFTPQSSRRNIVVRHRDGTSYTYDLQLFLQAGVPQSSEALAGGDVIYVPRTTTQIGAWGGVARPGVFELGQHDSLRTLLQLAGGLLPSAQTGRALIVRMRNGVRSESTWISVDAGSRDLDMPLRDGDLLYVTYDPERRDIHQVSLVGHVVRAGEYPITVGKTRLSDVIESAGGFRAGAATSTIRLIRTHPDRSIGEAEFQRLSRLSREQMTESEYESFQTEVAVLEPEFLIDWARVKHGDPALDPLVLDGDVIRVDRTTRTVRVGGQVRRPGVFEYAANRSVSDYIRLAGGFNVHGARSRVRVTRAVNGQSVHARDAGDIAPGDFIWVPERPDKTTWDYFKDLVTISAQVATVIIAVRR